MWPGSASNRQSSRTSLSGELLAAVTAVLVLAGGLGVALVVGAAAHGAAFNQAVVPCPDANPYLATTLFIRGVHPAEPAVVSFRHEPDGAPVTLATQRDVGSVYGLAFDRPRARVYVAAYHKRGSPFGPGGPGAIYRLDLSTGAAALWVNVPNTGADVHDPSGAYFPDWSARAGVGRTGLGDIDLSEDGADLFAMNLFDHQIYRYRTADAALAGVIPMGAAGEAWAADARPFALAVHGGKLYHGLVDAATRSQSVADLTAYVYESALDGGGMRLVCRFGLGFDRGLVDHPANVAARWRPWNDRVEFKPGTASGTGWNINPQPMLTDIEFAADDDMLLGFRDRYGDMGFYDPSGLNPGGEGTTIPAGDILIAHFNGTTWDGQTVPEYFAQDNGPSFGAIPVHDETGFGGLARVEAVDEVVTSAFAPLDIVTGGALWFDNATARNTARAEIYRLQGTVNFAKANGLGDVERLCEAPPATTTPDAPAPATASPTLTVVPSTTPAPTVTPSLTAAPTSPPAPATMTPVTACVCRIARERLPAAVLQDALANPERYYGWRYLLDPGKPESPANPRRECLTLQNVGLDYHPISNGPVWRVGCP